MVKNKRGFIRILEAIIAIIIVFVYVVNVLPKAPAATGKIPPELDNTLNAILKQIQNDPNFREQVVIYRETGDVKEFIKQNLPPFSPWKYAFKICTAGVEDCGFFFPAADGTADEAVRNKASFDSKLIL